MIGNAKIIGSIDAANVEDYDGSGFSLHTAAMLISGSDTNEIMNAMKNS